MAFRPVWYDATAVAADAAAAAARGRYASPTPLWLMDGCPLATSVPLRAFGFWHSSLARVTADGRAIALPPRSLQRDTQTKAKVVLQILNQGAAWATQTPRSFIEMMLRGEVQLPSAISAPSVILRALLHDPVRLADSLRIDGRGLASLPPSLQDDTVLCWAACHAPARVTGCPWVSARLLDSLAFMKGIVRHNPSAYRWASARLKSSSISLLQVAIAGGNRLSLHMTFPPLRRCHSAARMALVSARTTSVLPVEVRSDRAAMLFLAATAETQGARVGLGLCEALDMRNDALFQLELVKRAPTSIGEVPLRRNPVFLRVALVENPWLLAEPGVHEAAVSLHIVPPCGAALWRYLEGPAAAETASAAPKRPRAVETEEEASETEEGQPPLKRSRLVDELKCPVCLEIVHGKVLQCLNGHILCSACAERIPRGASYRCPICRASQSPERLARNLVAEFLVSSLHWPTRLESD